MGVKVLCVWYSSRLPEGGCLQDVQAAGGYLAFLEVSSVALLWSRPCGMDVMTGAK